MARDDIVQLRGLILGVFLQVRGLGCFSVLRRGVLGAAPRSATCCWRTASPMISTMATKATSSARYRRTSPIQHAQREGRDRGDDEQDACS